VYNYEEKITGSPEKKANQVAAWPASAAVLLLFSFARCPINAEAMRGEERNPS
jgi:hypothetical protein